MRPDANTVRRTVEEYAGEVAEEAYGVVCRIPSASVPAAMSAMVESGYEFLVDLFANDTGERLEVTYHLRSLSMDTELFVRTAVPYDGEVGSVWESYPSALYAEREAAELFGLSFPGHPNPKRLLTCDEVDVYMMRKDVPIRTHEEVRRDG